MSRSLLTFGAQIQRVYLQFLKPTPRHEELTLDEYRAAFKEYYKNIRNFIYFKCSDRDLAEDITQDVFVKLWETRLHIDKRTIKAYLYTIAHNLMVNHFKRRQLQFNFQKLPATDREYDTPQKAVEMKEYGEKLQQVLAELPDGGREVFLMNRLEDMTYQEIADRLGLSVKAIEKRMTKVLRILRNRLGTDL